MPLEEELHRPVSGIGDPMVKPPTSIPVQSPVPTYRQLVSPAKLVPAVNNKQTMTRNKKEILLIGYSLLLGKIRKVFQNTGVKNHSQLQQRGVINSNKQL